MDPEKNQVSPDAFLRDVGASAQGEKNLHEEEPQVYNVMPRSVHTGSTPQPSVAVVDNSIDGLNQNAGATAGSLLPKILKISIIALAVLGLAYAGYRFGPKYYDRFFVANKTENKPALPAADQNTPDAMAQRPTTTPDQASAPPAALPADWLKKYFGKETCDNQAECGPGADPDLDGLANQDEYHLNTDPNNSDSDADGLADGDEAHVFMSNPMKKYSNDDPKYTDTDYFRGGYDLNTTQLMTPDRIQGIKDRMTQSGLHQPTVSSLGDALTKIYGFNLNNDLGTQNQSASSTPSSTPDQALDGFDVSPEAQQDRDAQRTTTIKNIGIGLVKYYETNQSYPKTSNFKEMYDAIRVYMKVATNPQDPVNKEPYVYSYSSNPAGDDFTLAYYSEVVRQLIKKHAADAQKDRTTEEAAIYDDQRVNDLKRLQTALLLYSSKHAAGNQDNVFPSTEKYKTELLASGDISDIPRDPKTLKDYDYQVNDTFTTFTIKATLDNPPNGSTGYLCNQLECDYY